MTAPTPTWSDSCAADPEPPPDDDDLAPWCKWPRDLFGQHASTDRLDAMTVLNINPEYL